MTTTQRNIVKIVIVGDAAVGKTSFLRRYKENIFVDAPHITTSGGIRETIQFKDGENVTLDFWDTAGQESYMQMVPMYFRGSRGSLLCFDLTNRESFIRAKEIWLKQIAQHSPTNSRTVLIGTKADLADLRQVSPEEAKEFAHQAGFPFIETSSRLDINIKEAVKLLVNEIEAAGPIVKPIVREEPTPSTRAWCIVM